MVKKRTQTGCIYNFCEKQKMQSVFCDAFL